LSDEVVNSLSIVDLSTVIQEHYKLGLLQTAGEFLLVVFNEKFGDQCICSSVKAPTPRRVSSININTDKRKKGHHQD
jgi:hypothetical protein